MTIHMRKTEVTDNFNAVLDELKDGNEVIVEQEGFPVAVIRSPKPEGRLITESIAIAKANDSQVTLDDEFMRDVEEGIRQRSKPWDPPAWD